MRSLIKYIFLVCLFSGLVSAQMSRSYLVHNRGMLHQSVYNTGELGRKYDATNANTDPGVPSFEWPGNFASGSPNNFYVVVDGRQYTGHQNSWGGGIQMGGNRARGLTRLYAFCGGMNDIGVVDGQQSFPLSQERIENFPVKADGSLNPSYNPDEAEEKIISKWTTPIGITVTRTSRTWSFPDYDDFIIYEYEFENTGDLKPPTTPDTARVTDLIINFSYGLTGGKFGYNRISNSWSNTVIEPNINARFDKQRWLQYALHRTGNPEPKYFEDWATKGTNGGGLLSPQAPGYMVLFYDTVHLARRGEGTSVLTPGTDSVSWDSNNHIKQPYSMIVETQNITTSKILRDFLDIANVRKYSVNTNLTVFGSDWLGRAKFNWGQSVAQAFGRDFAFGPYNLSPGEKVHITIADVCGYGAARAEETEAGVKDMGGSNGNSAVMQTPENGDAQFAFYTVPNYWVPKRQNELNTNSVNTVIYGSDYLSRYSLPDYVNSNVVTVREVADRAIHAFTNEPLMNYDTVQYWPAKYGAHGIYALPIPVPAPAIEVQNTSVGENKITWGPDVEAFSTPRLQGPFDHYELSKAVTSFGPWNLLARIEKRDSRYYKDGKYEFLDKHTIVGDNFYYSLISVDSFGNKSGRTNVTLHETSIGAEPSLKRVFVAPNPLIVNSGFAHVSVDGKEVNNELRFYNLPSKCTIQIFSYSGQLIRTIEHDSNVNLETYDQLTRNRQLLASGVYFYVVVAPDGTKCNGKFVIIN